jgi:hypothetical protein
VLVAYPTTDEVNDALALRMAAESGVTLCPLALQGSAPDGDFDAVLYDWDYLPVERRQTVLENVMRAQTSDLVALHGYHLEDD